MSDIKDIYLEKLEEIKTAVVTNSKRFFQLPIWVKIMIIASFILMTINLITIFKKHDAPNQDYLKTISDKDSTIKYQQKTIDALQAGQAARDSVIIEQLSRIGANKSTQTKIIHQYDQVPNSVRSLDKSGLRGEITNY